MPVGWHGVGHTPCGRAEQNLRKGSCAIFTRRLSSSAPPGVFLGRRGERYRCVGRFGADGTLQGCGVSLERSERARKFVAQALTMQLKTVMIRGCHGNVKAHK
jgi:hypothetical protein